ncbi:conserved hypothetical protein [uncultured Mycobacterium sp.]|uniref:Uncharacterized protein n=1 Tax=uncultured Mycobacterium sp. TaxID=171292 RepID=A0A1Y5PN91_9MYCO|nr:conserved hypothetical protein [uncultured Mycobacterium sp.]
MGPILLTSCAGATSAEETRFRIDATVPVRDGIRVIALDAAAADVIHRLTLRHHSAIRLLSVPEFDRDVEEDLPLQAMDGTCSNLAAALAEADLVVMVATTAVNPRTAETIARACSSRGVMTVGVILQRGCPDGPALRALRPHAQVLIITNDHSDIAEVLSALRA